MRGHARATIVASCTLTLGCHLLTEPALPSGAERFDPPPVYAQWWALTEACSAVTRPLSAVEFYRVPHVSVVPTPDHGDVAGYWSSASNRIVLAGDWADHGRTVRHEMLHALVRGAGHPPIYFQGVCAGVVDCPEVGCRDAGPEPTRAPAGAPVLPVAALDIRMELLPNRVSRSGADTVLTIVVRVTNPRRGPVWVPLEATPTVPGAPAYAGFFGFAIRPVGTEARLIGMQQSIPTAPVPFAAGETRQNVFDLNVKRYPAGDYTIGGLFNTRQVSSTLRVVP
jgi:hypothetical protein